MFDEVDSYNAEYERLEYLAIVCEDAEELGRGLRREGYHWSDAATQFPLNFPDAEVGSGAVWSAFCDGWNSD